jgi:short-subunit dehydrogenase
MSQRKPIAFITGVSSGIGLALTMDLLSKGYRVIGTVRNSQAATAMAEDLGKGFSPLILDVTRESEEINQIISELSQKEDNLIIDILIHNAGVAHGGPLLFQPEADQRAVIETNVMGVLKLTRALYTKLQPGSRVLLISSVSGRLVTPFLGIYAASKFAVEALTDALRHELGMLGIKVVTIQPGPIKTKIWDKARQNTTDYSVTPYADIMARQDAFVDKAEGRALPVERVTEAVWKAIRSKNPRTRYLVVKAPFMIILAKLFPDRWKDRLILKRLK